MISSFTKKMIVFLLALFLWITLPHFLLGIPCILSMLIMMIALACFFRWSRNDMVVWNIPENLLLKLNAISYTLSLVACISLLLIIPLILTSVENRRIIISISFGFYAIIWFFVMCCIIIASHSEHSMLFKTRLLSDLSSIPLLAFTLAIMKTVLFGLEASIRIVIIPFSLAVIIFSFIYYQISGSVPVRQLDYTILSSIVVAFLLFFVLNVTLDSTKNMVRYQLKPGTTETCIIENGRTFHFKNCPISEGAYGWVNDHEGWFHIRYITRLYEG